jgi:hypothetical protein
MHYIDTNIKELEDFTPTLNFTFQLNSQILGEDWSQILEVKLL